MTNVPCHNSALPASLCRMIRDEYDIIFMVSPKNADVKFPHGRTPWMVVRPERRAMRRSTPRALPEQVGKRWKCCQ